MTAFTAIVVGLAIGFLIRERRKAYLVWLPIWALVLLGQTVLLARTDDSVDGVYPFVQAAIFVAGVACVWLGGRLRKRRRPVRASSSPPVPLQSSSSASRRARVGYRLKTLLLVIATGALVGGCSGQGGDADQAAPEPASSTTAPAQIEGQGTESGARLVGEWKRETTCDELVQALRDAGMDELVDEFIAGNGFIPGISVDEPEQIDVNDPCKGAVPRVHSHFFTEDGAFGSRDWTGKDVDDGRYRVMGDKLVISKEFPDVTFRFRIEGDTITFDPLNIPAGCTTFRCGWSIAVAYPGEKWRREQTALEPVIDGKFQVGSPPQGGSRSLDRGVAGLTGHILFTRAGGSYGDETLFVARANGTGQRRISKVGGTCCPWATPDGSRIVFGASGSGGRITAATASLDGTHRIVFPLPKGTLNLASGPFTANGKTIAREGFDDEHPRSAGIYLTRASDGKILRRVTRKHFIPGDFSPNGKQLVLFKGPEGDSPPPGSLWLVNTSGRGLRRLTPAKVSVQCCGNYRWSPDGTKILFADSSGVLWTIAPDRSKLTQVFKDGNGRYAVTPTWSPDGSMIMFALDPTPDPFQHPNNGLYVINADGSGLAEVIGGNDFKREPVWVSG